MRVDLERLRRSLARYVHAEENAVPVAVGDLAALLAVVDAARNGVLAWSEGAYSDIDVGSLEAALEPFGPEQPDRAWEEVDRWNAEQARAYNETQAYNAFPESERDLGWHAAQQAPEWVRTYAANLGADADSPLAERDLAVKAAVDATPKPVHSKSALLREQDCEPPSSEGRREWTRDYVALVGEVVQRQFRSDQERISELERECDLRAAESASANELIAEIKDRLSRVPALVEALREIDRIVEPWDPSLPRKCRDIAIQALAEWAKP